MLPISSGRMKSRCVGKESRHDASQNRIWITYTRQPTEWWMRPSPLYTVCSGLCRKAPPQAASNHLATCNGCWGKHAELWCAFNLGPDPPGPQMPRPRLGTRTWESPPLAAQWPQELLLGEHLVGMMLLPQGTNWDTRTILFLWLWATVCNSSQFSNVPLW